MDSWYGYHLSAFRSQFNLISSEIVVIHEAPLYSTRKPTSTSHLLQEHSIHFHNDLTTMENEDPIMDVPMHDAREILHYRPWR